MADINHSHAGEPPVEGDGINYRGIVWFVGVLAVTTIASALGYAVIWLNAMAQGRSEAGRRA